MYRARSQYCCLGSKYKISLTAATCHNIHRLLITSNKGYNNSLNRRCNAEGFCISTASMMIEAHFASILWVV